MENKHFQKKKKCYYRGTYIHEIWIMQKQEQLKNLRETLEKLYSERSKELLFHGWHHIIFVVSKSREFAQSIWADDFLVESSALVHDLNYLVEQNSEPEAGKKYRTEILENTWYNSDDISQIEKIIWESHTANQSEIISEEGKCLSDADNVFKALPITPILFTWKYIQECGVDIQKLAEKITSEQNKLFESSLYFYTDLAKEKYLGWAETNLKLWNNVNNSLEDPDVREMLHNAKKIWVL